ncbi:MAG: Asp-tRNA(Asn)/Glu-tRNA(Gln) amidotransferase subunit GatB [bacterium]
MNKYQPVIGLEVHVELITNSKMFCGCDANHFEIEPNTHTCPVCLGLPGALPVPNRKAVDWTILLGLALNCKINKESHFDRKNYFYPDLPKGYQITQFNQPLCVNGHIQLANGKIIRIREIHIEEDTGKLIHGEVDGQKVTLIDFDRSGVPLAEIVTEPDFNDSGEVDEYLKTLQRIIRYLKISNADMEKGSMRLEPSISLRPDGQKKLTDYRVEIKNINSFHFVKKAIEFEIRRQTELLEKGETPKQETRGWSETKGVTVLQREKEEAHDYRYFPEPDIPPMTFSDEMISEIKKQIPELTEAKIKRLISQYGLSSYQAKLISETKELANFFEETTKIATDIKPVQIANWIINDKPDISAIHGKSFISAKLLSQQIVTVDEKKLDEVIDQVIKENQDAVASYHKGKINVIGFLIGQVVKLTDPKIDRQLVTAKILEKLSR